MEGGFSPCTRHHVPYCSVADHSRHLALSRYTPCETGFQPSLHTWQAPSCAELDCSARAHGNDADRWPRPCIRFVQCEQARPPTMVAHTLGCLGDEAGQRKYCTVSLEKQQAPVVGAPPTGPMWRPCRPPPAPTECTCPLPACCRMQPCTHTCTRTAEMEKSDLSS